MFNSWSISLCKIQDLTPFFFAFFFVSVSLLIHYHVLPL